MISERIIMLLSKRIANEATTAELSELEKALAQHPDYFYLEEILLSVESDMAGREAIDNAARTEHGWQALEKRLEWKGGAQADTKSATEGILETGSEERNTSNPLWVPSDTPKRRFDTRWWQKAAIWVAVAIGGMVSYYYIHGRVEKQPGSMTIHQINIPNGAPVEKKLPDGSTVWLNAGSHIRYDSNFIQKNRDIYLEGEGYFNVAHDPRHPFIVHAANLTIQALGTKFNVHAYENENRVEATLISGKIAVKIDGKPEQNIILEPKEKLTVVNQTVSRTKQVKEISYEVKGIQEMSAISTAPEIAWLQDKLAFENESFQELARKMERRFDVHIIFKDSMLGEERLSGVFENENIQKALRILQMTTDFHYTLSHDTAYINY